MYVFTYTSVFQLAFLDLSGNPIGDNGAANICQGMSMINSLKLRQCCLTSDGISVISQACNSMEKPVGVSYDLFI